MYTFNYNANIGSTIGYWPLLVAPISDIGTCQKPISVHLYFKVYSSEHKDVCGDIMQHVRNTIVYYCGVLTLWLQLPIKTMYVP